MTWGLNSKTFLLVGGAVLVLVGVLGYVGVIGPTPEQSIFGQAWYFDNVENLAHTVLGLAALALVGLKLEKLYNPVTLLVALLALFFGVYNFFLGDSMPNLGTTNLENPTDLLLHLGVGAWAFTSWWMSRQSPPARS